MSRRYKVESLKCSIFKRTTLSGLKNVRRDVLVHLATNEDKSSEDFTAFYFKFDDVT